MKLLISVFPTILLMAYSQLVIKWRVTKLAALAAGPATMPSRTVQYLTDPYIVSAYVSAFLSAIAWLYVAERYPVSIAFPTYVGVLFALVTVGGVLLLKETLSLQHLGGLLLILVGVIVISRGA
jgi:multidrug transporter EmrE-like cation transporter